MLERAPRFPGPGAPNAKTDALYTDPGFDAWSRIDADAVAALRRHPRFPDALRAFGTMVAALYHGSRLASLITNDRGRALLALFALHLHYTRRPDDPVSGLTAARLQALFVETGLGSAGRAKALITLMRWGGYIEDAPLSRDRRVKALQPTAKMLAMHRERWSGALGAAGLVLPAAAAAHARFDAPGFLRAYAIAQTSEFQGGFRLLDHGPELKLFADRNAGFPIMFAILLSAAPEDGMPPTGAIPVSASALAKRFHVSRTQVNRLLHDAQAAGLLERSGRFDIRVRFLPRFAENFEKLFGALLLLHAACAQYALGEIDRGGATSP